MIYLKDFEFRTEKEEDDMLGVEIRTCFNSFKSKESEFAE